MSPAGPNDRTVVPSSEAPQIGGYTVLRLLGHGGAGRVFAARDEQLGRTVAIKVLHPQVAHDPKNVERFLREARAMATISSPHVASVFQVGQHRKVPFIVMEYLEGQNLEQRLHKDKRIPVEEALIYARDCALALKAANAAGIVHRDVKPANILVIDGRAKLTDFGTARPMDGSADMTIEGQIAGTATFMAPERMMGKGDDRRADIYSLGATLYCLIEGDPPFVRQSPMDVIAAHLKEEPVPLEQKVPGVSPIVGGLVKRMMAKDPARRFQSYEELITAIEALLKGGAQSFGDAGAFDENTEVMGEGLATLPPAPSFEGPADLNDPFGAPASSPFGGAPQTSSMVGEPTGVMGTLKQMSIVDICQMLEMGKKDAEIELTALDGQSGELCFLGGQVVQCVWGQQLAEEAFYTLVRRKEGFFRIHYGRRTTRQNIDVPTAFLLLEAMRRLDEQERGGAAPHQPIAHDDDPAPSTVKRQPGGPRDTTLPSGPPASLSDEPPSLPDAAGNIDALFVTPPTPFGPPPTSGSTKPPRTPAARERVPTRPPMSASRRTPSSPSMTPAPVEGAPPVHAAARPPPSAPSSSPAFDRSDTLRLTPEDEAALRDLEGRGVPLSQRLERAFAPVAGAARSVRDAVWSQGISPALSGANRQLADATARVLERAPSFAPLARQIRARPWLPLLALCASCFGLAFAAVALLSMAPPAELSVARIERGEAALVLQEIESVPLLERTAKQELYRGHALAALARVPEALRAYRSAAKLGVTDERGLDLALRQLPEANPVEAMDLLVESPADDVTDALLERVADDSWLVRHNALIVLDERGAKDRVDLEALAIQDLLSGPTCKQRRLGLLDLQQHGKTQKARDAFKKAYALKDADNACMRADLEDMLPG